MTVASTGTCCDDPLHRGVQTLVGDLNRAYRDMPALHQRDCEADGFAGWWRTTATTA